MQTTLLPARRGSWLRAFKDHPASVGETYVEHMGFAGWFAGRLFIAGAAALIDAVIPPCSSPRQAVRSAISIDGLKAATTRIFRTDAVEFEPLAGDSDRVTTSLDRRLPDPAPIE